MFCLSMPIQSICCQALKLKKKKKKKSQKAFNKLLHHSLRCYNADDKFAPLNHTTDLLMNCYLHLSQQIM